MLYLAVSVEWSGSQARAMGATQLPARELPPPPPPFLPPRAKNASCGWRLSGCALSRWTKPSRWQLCRSPCEAVYWFFSCCCTTSWQRSSALLEELQFARWHWELSTRVARFRTGHQDVIHCFLELVTDAWIWQGVAVHVCSSGQLSSRRGGWQAM